MPAEKNSVRCSATLRWRREEDAVLMKLEAWQRPMKPGEEGMTAAVGIGDGCLESSAGAGDMTRFDDADRRLVWLIFCCRM